MVKKSIAETDGTGTHDVHSENTNLNSASRSSLANKDQKTNETDEINTKNLSTKGICFYGNK